MYINIRNFLFDIDQKYIIIYYNILKSYYIYYNKSNIHLSKGTYYTYNKYFINYSIFSFEYIYILNYRILFLKKIQIYY